VHRLPLSHLQPSLPWSGSVPETTDTNLIKILSHLNSPSSFSWACVNILQVVAQFLITNKTAIYEDLSHIHCCQHLQPPQKTAALHPNHMNLNSKTSQHLMYPLALNRKLSHCRAPPMFMKARKEAQPCHFGTGPSASVFCWLQQLQPLKGPTLAPPLHSSHLETLKDLALQAKWKSAITLLST
jgi:hypothetical protein